MLESFIFKTTATIIDPSTFRNVGTSTRNKVVTQNAKEEERNYQKCQPNTHFTLQVMRKFFVFGKRFVRYYQSRIFFHNTYQSLRKEGNLVWKPLTSALLVMSVAGAYLYNQLVRKKSFERRPPIKDCVRENTMLANVYVGTCVAISLAWRAAFLCRSRAATSIMMRNFAIHRDCMPHAVVLYSLSHIGPIHLALNCFAGHSFIVCVAAYLGPKEIAALFFCASSTGALIQLANNNLATKSFAQPLTIGASGGVWGLLTFVASVNPQIPFNVLFIPWLQFPAWAFTTIMASIDLLGLIRRWKSGIAHGVHVGGFIVGGAIGGLVYLTERSLPLSSLIPVVVLPTFQQFLISACSAESLF